MRDGGLKVGEGWGIISIEGLAIVIRVEIRVDGEREEMGSMRAIVQGRGFRPETGRGRRKWGGSAEEWGLA